MLYVLLFFYSGLRLFEPSSILLFVPSSVRAFVCSSVRAFVYSSVREEGGGTPNSWRRGIEGTSPQFFLQQFFLQEFPRISGARSAISVGLPPVAVHPLGERFFLTNNLSYGIIEVYW